MKKTEPLAGNPLEIKVNINNRKIEYEIGSKRAKGDIHAGRNDTFTLSCPGPFAIFVGELTEPVSTAKPHGWVHDPTPAGQLFILPGPGPVYASTGNRLDFKVHGSAPPGAHKFSVVVLHDDGSLVIDDPQIIID